MLRARWLVLVVIVGACGKEPAKAVPVPETPPTPRLSEAEVTARNTLAITERGAAFELADGAHRVTITLPQRPTIDNQTMRESGVAVFNSQAIMPGGPVDAQFGVATVLDDMLPPAMMDQMSAVPEQLAAAAGGSLAANQASTLVGHPGRSFEIKTSDGRRLFGWYVAVAEHARVYQLNCVGPEGDATRAACGAIMASLKLAP
ncbi:MAG: hypothetical protein K8W52_20755 [Deltaproteobacteria bacterium]|nr:hypothetical protein [Deltaproteobacteria bacterium]